MNLAFPTVLVEIEDLAPPVFELRFWGINFQTNLTDIWRLIRRKRIYNFCLFHAYMGDFATCFATLSYLFNIFGLT